MKKAKIKIIIFIICCVIATSVLALSGTDKVSANLTSSKEKLKEGEEIIIELKFDKYNNIVKGLNAFQATLEYDDEIFAKVEQRNFTTKNNWEQLKYNKDTKEFVAIKKAGSKSEESIVQIALTVKRDVEPAKTQIGIKEIITSEGKEDLLLNDTNVQVDIIKEQPVRPPEEPAKITSNKYKIEKEYISNVLPNTNINKFKSNVTTKGNVVFTDETGKTLSSDSIIKTGTIIKIGNTLRYTIIVTGDINKDGEMDIDDLAEMKFHIIDKKLLSGIKLRAADINKDDEVSIDDVAKMKLVIIDKIKLED